MKYVFTATYYADIGSHQFIPQPYLAPSIRDGCFYSLASDSVWP